MAAYMTALDSNQGLRTTIEYDAATKETTFKNEADFDAAVDASGASSLVFPAANISGAGAGSGLDADKLDGQEGSYYNDASNLVIEAADDWTGKFDGQEGSWYQDLANSTGEITADQITGGTLGRLLHDDGVDGAWVTKASIDAADFGSGAAGANYVLTADGAAGVSWQTAGVPGAHASTHEENGTDEMELGDMGTTEMSTAKVLKPDGAGGVAWAASEALPVGTVNHASLVYDTGTSDWIENTKAKFDDADGSASLANGNMTVDGAGNIVAVGGDFSGAVDSAGNFSVATNKLTVAAATGNTVVAGTFDVDGATTLDGTTIDTTDANFVVSGGGTVDINVATDISGNLTLGGMLDTSAAGALELGPATATSVLVADAGVMTTVEGTLNVDEAVTFDSTCAVTGDLTVTNTVDTIGAATLLLGDTNATKVEIADSGVETNVQGTMKVDEQADFTANLDASAGVDIDADNQKLTIGAGSDVEIVHDGANSTMTSKVGDFILDNTNATGATNMDLGTDTSATEFAVRNNSGNNKFTVKGDGASEFANDLVVKGDLTVEGTTTTVESQTVLYNDHTLWLGQEYTTTVGHTGGLAVNYLPTATNDTVAATGFTAGVNGVSNPTVHTVAAAAFAQNDLVMISGAADATNNGLFEVHSSAGNLLTIRGVGTTGCVEAFTQNQFATDTTVAGTITKVNVSVIRTGTDGEWESGKGAVTPLVFKDFTQDGDVTLQDAYENGNEITTDGGNGNVSIIGNQEVVIGGTNDLRFTGVDMDLDPTGNFDLSMDAGKKITMEVDPALADGFKLWDGAKDFMVTDTVNDKLIVGQAGVALDVAENATVGGTLGVTGLTTLTGGSKHPDDATAAFGDASNLTIKHTAAGVTEIKNTTGDMTIENAAVASDIILKSGDAAGVTGLLYKDSGGTTQFGVDSDGNMTVGAAAGGSTITLDGELGWDAYGWYTYATVDAGGAVTKDQTVYWSDNFKVLEDPDQSTEAKTVGGIAMESKNAAETVKIRMPGGFAEIVYNDSAAGGGANPVVGMVVASNADGGVKSLAQVAMSDQKLQELGKIVSTAGWANSGDSVVISFNPLSPMVLIPA